ncbi:MAG: hypothetical protein NTW17_01625 [Candidatus Pacearchaeota archaeon]|nr:hypothetical protein [Candidatus Pacearchaeota archaeon]
MSDNNKKNKRAQMGETITWVVATVIIIAVLIFSIYLASLLANTRKTLVFASEERSEDIVMEKSLFAYFLADESQREIIYNELKKKDFSADLDAKLNEIRGVLE